MRCVLKKMKSDVVKSITLKNIADAAIFIFIAVIVSVLILIALNAVLGLLEYRTSAYIARMVVVLVDGFMLVSLGRIFYSWYNKSKKWCDNRGDEDVM